MNAPPAESPPLDQAAGLGSPILANRLSPLMFAGHGIVPVGYAAFTFATPHARLLVTYQPASRYWALQWYETAILLAVTLALAGACFWWIGRRRIG
jgi:hypothetical protein